MSLKSRTFVSIPNRIALAFIAVSLAFGFVSYVSLLAHHQTAKSLRLLYDGYIPLTLMVGEARSTETLFGSMVERVVREEDPAGTLSWLRTARLIRPLSIDRAQELLSKTEALRPDSLDRSLLLSVRTDLSAARVRVQSTEEILRTIEAALRDDPTRMASLLARFRSDETQLERLLRRTRERVQERMQDMGRTAAAEEERTVWVSAMLLTAALLLATIALLWTRALLNPLPGLLSRVAAVAQGDLSARPAPTRKDELAALGREFENMVSALSARDRQIADARLRLLETEKLAAMGRMAAHVAHEIRNPLSSLGLNLELLAEDIANESNGNELSGPMAAEKMRTLRSMRSELDRLAVVTDEYLRIARLPTPRKEDLELDSVVRETIEFMRPEFEQAEIELLLHTNAPIAIPLDAAQMRQALLNILKNAREAMQDQPVQTTEPAPEVRIEVRTGSNEDFVWFEVLDLGPGFEETNREQAFELFFSTKASGTGLGLALVLQIVQAHGGRVELSNRAKPAQGASVKVWLPRTSTNA